MNILIAEVRAGKREGSVISTQGFEEAAENDRATWSALQRDLENVGVSAEAIEDNKPMIINWFREAVAAGKLEEDEPPWDDASTLNMGDSASFFEKKEAGPVRAGSGDSVVKRALMAFRRSSSSEALSKDVDVQKGGNAVHRESSTPPIQFPDWKDSKLQVSYLLSKLQGKNVALLEAAKADDERQIRALLAKGAKVGEVDQLGETALHIAAAVSTDGRTVQTLLDTGVDVNLIGTQVVMSQTPLISACRNHAVDTARILLRHGADPNIDCNGTAISYAAMHGNTGVVQLLLEHGVDVEAHWRNDTVLHIAARRSHTAIVQLLLDHDADVHARSRRGLTALGIAASEHRGKGIIQMLLDRGADIEDKSPNECETPLHMAARVGFLDNVRALLGKGADIDARNSNGETPLMRAVQSKQLRGTDIVRLLLNSFADPYAADTQGHTVLFWAKQRESGVVKDEVIQLLQEWGAQRESSQPYPSASQNTSQSNDQQHSQIYNLPYRGAEPSGQPTPQPYYQRYNEPYGGVSVASPPQSQ